MSTRTFHAGDILSVLQPHLVSPQGVKGVQDLLEFMTGDSLHPHQLGRAAGECRDSLAVQHPDLAAVAEAIPVAALADRETGLAWLASFPDAAARDVAPLPPEDHTHIDPRDEAVARYGVAFTSQWIVA